MKKILILGLTGVGKTSIFNKFSKKSMGLVSFENYSTRNFFSCILKVNNIYFRLYDSIGLNKKNNTIYFNNFFNISFLLNKFDAFIFVTDIFNIYLNKNTYIYKSLINSNKKIFYIVNKIDCCLSIDLLEIKKMEVEEKIYYISVLKNKGMKFLIKDIEKYLKGEKKIFRNFNLSCSISLVGKENSGKSTIFNILINYYKSYVKNEKGTTTNLVESYIKYREIFFKIIDTAGITNIKNNSLKYFSTKLSLKSLIKSNFICLIIDSLLGISKRDEKIFIFSKKNYKFLFFIYNKIDLVSKKRQSHFQKSTKDNCCLFLSKYDISKNKFFSFFILFYNLFKKSNIFFNKNQIFYFEKFIKRKIKIKFSNISQTNSHPIEFTFYNCEKVSKNLFLFLRNKISLYFKLKYIPFKIKIK